jgi:hypothetical protein
MTKFTGYTHLRYQFTVTFDRPAGRILFGLTDEAIEKTVKTISSYGSNGEQLQIRVEKSCI